MSNSLNRCKLIKGWVKLFLNALKCLPVDQGFVCILFGDPCLWRVIDNFATIRAFFHFSA